MLARKLSFAKNWLAMKQIFVLFLTRTFNFNPALQLQEDEIGSSHDMSILFVLFPLMLVLAVLQTFLVTTDTIQ